MLEFVCIPVLLRVCYHGNQKSVVAERGMGRGEGRPW